MSEREVIVHLIGNYETALNNASRWRIDIKKLLKNQKNQRFVQNIMERRVNAIDNFSRSIEQQDKKKFST